ncbi:hypothetical protein HMPREF0860_1390 [Treponema socranskii subsp. socranskii VPI DR56BR1116 = ATCC 35536]|uniref:Uncharacterized protein n=1 Tax=Treponema socranskii subsp. socranskii VPI DR56BR1116 = ATCC 35536 TaxID=1125725 RepID=U1FKX7_TRESO|nr:hypothetical protein [Treponema socranskii]ERF60041.1 hypothetical protein HMPREF1325_1164 [Treponema socranskii subsp. socranskii VPI DR56BR1116 = ATCC 35536]ERK01475.1 hypothetical protein HMPREF0860_1390 [Treponema socranskii subsp. socranskii VPI DR56BR1116 = ATCC 35536]
MPGVLFAIVAINIVLWGVFIVRFKRLFSADDVIEKTRAEMDNMIRDINNNTVRAIDIIDDRTKQLKRLIEEADRRIALARSEEAKKLTASALRDTLEKKSVSEVSRRAANTYKKNVPRSRPSPDASYAVTGEAEALAEMQHSLFDDTRTSVRTKAEMNVTDDGASYAKVPVIKPDVYFSETPIVPKKNFTKQVLEMAEMGLTIEQIAKQLSCSKTEVQMILDMQ